MLKDNDEKSIRLPGRITSTADIILVSVVTNYRVLGSNFGSSVAFPFIKNRIQLNSLDVSTPFAYTDMFARASLGWSLKRADVNAGYNLYIPTGKFSAGGPNNTGPGIWGNEVYAGSTIYLDQIRRAPILMSATWEPLKVDLAGRATRKLPGPSQSL